MENQNKSKLNPTNNMTLFSTLADVFGQTFRDEMTEEKANTLCNIAGKMQKSLDIEISRYKAIAQVDATKAKFREIEVIVPDDKQSQLRVASESNQNHENNNSL